MGRTKEQLSEELHMHTTKINNATFLHDGDHGGDVIIVGRDDNGNPSDIARVRIEMADLLEFVAGAARESRLADFEREIEKMTDRQLLGFWHGGRGG